MENVKALLPLCKLILGFSLLCIFNCCKEDKTEDLSPEPLPPVITSIEPVSGKVGTEVTIKGQNFGESISANNVQFNGTTASIKEANSTQLITEVPAGATSGIVSLSVGQQRAEGPEFIVEEEVNNIYDCTLNTITEDTSWPNLFEGDTADYIIKCAITIRDNAVLTLEPGVIIHFEGEDSGLFTSEGGALAAVGTKERPIQLMGTNKHAGVWQGIYLGSDNPQNKLEYVEVKHAGRTASSQTGVKAAVQLSKKDESRATIVNCTIKENDGYGLFVNEGSRLDVFSGNYFSNNQLSPVGLYFSMLKEVNTSNTFIPDHGQPYIDVRNDEWVSEGTIHSIDIPYRFSESQKYYFTDALRIQPGVTLEFVSDAGLRMGARASDCSSTTASLKAVGTPDSLITFKGSIDGHGSWLGIGINSSSPDNQLLYCQLSGGGAAKIFNANHKPANLVLQCESSITIQNSIISASAAYGISMHEEDAELLSFSENQIINNREAPLQIHFHQLGQLDTESTYKEGNGKAYIEVVGTALTENDMTISALDVAYRIGLSNAGRIAYVETSLNIMPGVVMEFETAAGIKLGNPSVDCIDNTGTLNAIGTADLPIIFKGLTSGQGSWRGIGINSSSPLNHLAYCEISGGGSEKMYNAGGQGNIVLQCSATLKVENSLIIDSGAWGIDKVGGSHTLTEMSNTFDNNASGDIAD